MKEGPVFSTGDGRLRLELSGRLHADGGFFDDDETPLENTSRIRRARLGVALTLWDDFTLRYQYDFAGEGRVLDASLTYEGIDPFEIRIGQFREPFSLEELTSSNHITFMERALPNEFAGGYNTGIAVYTHGENWSAAGGIFGEPVIRDVFGAADEDLAVTGRATFAPLRRKEAVVHLGVSASRREVDEGRRVRFSAEPETALTDENLLSTGSIRGVDQSYVVALESAFVKGPISLQGEYLHTALDREGGREDVEFSGGYAYASWFLTGETRPYSVKRGNFGRITPKRPTGAFEVALRYSILDLNDGPVSGGTEHNTTLGVNWYYRTNLRLMSNLVHAETDDEAGNENVNIFQFRAQLFF